MTERYAHFHTNGTMTAKLELVSSGETGAVEDFVRRHAERVRAGFDGDIAAEADASYERMCVRDRAYRYRPYTLRVEYSAACVRHSVTLHVFLVCMSGRRTVYITEEKHRFRIRGDSTIYLGEGKVEIRR